MEKLLCRDPVFTTTLHQSHSVYTVFCSVRLVLFRWEPCDVRLLEEELSLCRMRERMGVLLEGEVSNKVGSRREVETLLEGFVVEDFDMGSGLSHCLLK